MITANSWFKPHGYGSWPLFRKKCIIPSQERHGIKPRGIDLEEMAIHLPVMAFVNHGAWLVKCPDCEGAEYAWEEGFYYCFSCHNNSVGHQMRRLLFPEHREAIEAVLERRPLLNRNWEEPETVEDLLLENIAHADELLPV
jgi:hypothetical protein